MSKSFREKRGREKDNLETQAKHRPVPKNLKRSEKAVSNAIRSRDIETLMRYTEDED